jgi:dTDP-4-amino-4,6-dideoxygalactose transaminase
MIPHNRPAIEEPDIRAVEETLRSQWIAPGERVAAFEKQLASYLGVAGDAVAVDTGSAALHLSLLALDVGPGDEVILPTYVCSAVLNAVRYTGAAPVLADTGKGTANLTLAVVEPHLTDRTAAIVVPHMYGIPADIDPLKETGVPVIEDCAQSIGARSGDRKVGTRGDLAIFSFYATKLMTTAKGGAVVARERALTDTIRDLVEYDCRPVYRTRYNLRMSDLQAALGISQLRRLDRFLERRKAIASRYDAVIRARDTGFRTLSSPDSIFYRYVLLCPSSLDPLKALFARMGVQVINPLEPWELLHVYLGLDRGRFPHAEALAARTLSIPLYPSLSEDEIRTVEEALAAVTGGDAG